MKGKTLTRTKLSDWERDELIEIEAEVAHIKRPITRGDCVNAQRPCPWVSCRWHLYLDINTKTGSIKINTDGDVWDMGVSCALDVAEHKASLKTIQNLSTSEVTLEEVGGVMGLTRERVRQIEEVTLRKLKTNLNGHAEEMQEAISGDKQRPDLNRARGADNDEIIKRYPNRKTK